MDSQFFGEMRPDLTEKQLNRAKDLMNLRVRDRLIENYKKLIDKLSLPDGNDRYALAFAIKIKAEMIMTFN